MIVTLDSEACGWLGDQFKHTTGHLHCVRETDVFPKDNFYKSFEKRFNNIGPIAKYSKARRYWKQLITLYSVASGLNGVLGYRIKVLNENVLMLSKVEFFTLKGHEIFDYLQYEHLMDEDQAYKDKEGRDSDQSSFMKYGPLFYSYTKKSLVGSERAITDGISMTRTRTRKFLNALSMPSSSSSSNQADKRMFSWDKLIWIDILINSLCDNVADAGFSLYWYYFTFTIYDEDSFKSTEKMELKITETTDSDESYDILYPSILIRLPSPKHGLPVQVLESPWRSSPHLHFKDRCRWLQIVSNDISYADEEDGFAQGAYMVVFGDVQISED